MTIDLTLAASVALGAALGNAVPLLLVTWLQHRLWRRRKPTTESRAAMADR